MLKNLNKTKIQIFNKLNDIIHILLAMFLLQNKFSINVPMLISFFITGNMANRIRMALLLK